MDLLFLGSSFVFSAQGGRGKEKNCKPAEKIASPSEGEAEWGYGGNSARPTNFGRNLFEFFRTHTAIFQIIFRRPGRRFHFLEHS